MPAKPVSSTPRLKVMASERSSVAAKWTSQSVPGPPRLTSDSRLWGSEDGRAGRNAKLLDVCFRVREDGKQVAITMHLPY